MLKTIWKSVAPPAGAFKKFKVLGSVAAAEKETEASASARTAWVLLKEENRDLQCFIVPSFFVEQCGFRSHGKRGCRYAVIVFFRNQTVCALAHNAKLPADKGDSANVRTTPSRCMQ